MRKFIGLLAILALCSGCLIIPNRYQYHPVKRYYQFYGNYSFMNPIWFYSYLYNYYPYWQEYRRPGYMNYYIRMQINNQKKQFIRKGQLAKGESQQTVIKKNQISKKSGSDSNKIKVGTSKKVVKKK